MSNLPDDLIPLGKLIKPHGIKGQVKFKPYNQDSSILIKNMMVWLKKEEDLMFFKISSISYNSLHPIIKFNNVNDRNEAVKLRNYVLYVSRSSFPDAKKDDIYFVDLIGCKVYDRHEKFIGIAKDIAHFAEDNHILIVENDSKEFMIPLNNDLMKFFDVNEKYIVIDIIDGLLNNE